MSRYTSALAESMRITREGLVWEMLREMRWHVEMPRRGRYQVWRGSRLKIDRIKHRKEALALLKLLKGNENERPSV
jgi:hypothetical protein